VTTAPLTVEELGTIDAYWRASNYLSVGQIYLYDNPLLKAPLTKEHIKPQLLRHWGGRRASARLRPPRRIINRYDLGVLYVAGPGHGPGLVASTYLEARTARSIPTSRDARGMKRLFTQFRSPAASSHVAPDARSITGG
jgi:xylulose-5-phosphate/fructose-6-phosphate phosphoketolase